MKYRVLEGNEHLLTMLRFGLHPDYACAISGKVGTWTGRRGSGWTQLDFDDAIPNQKIVFCLPDEVLQVVPASA